ncbi:hypothetical protein [Paenilisteria newyorkensis]|uniref:hypothetical protein n=1 Tax=Listeria newyorkensis TaxID=1497681 RepID=UPI000669C35A|nr:hypothetical protein [Listeria newyorkensis]KMT62540.1 hypothetical protein X559_1078 [Listeria newyorkensis]
MAKLLDRPTTILPSNKKRQLEILREIIALQKNGNCGKSVSKLQTELEKLMAERDHAKRASIASQIIQEIAWGLEFDDLKATHFQLMKDKGITIREIARYFHKSNNAMYEHLKHTGIFKKKK